ncbi:peptidase M54 [Halodesulfurarchaeum formicicum]|uniref:Archaemetzincin n=2 Tax=Halodesulfurarchaeum formicicum TaxID=1873524 RepID=A0A1D8S608_9EURY|nr:peptidase M54 [Halodesulfurarchaeum formicicum]
MTVEQSQQAGRQSTHGGMFMADGAKTLLMRVDLVPIGEVPAPVKREASAVLRSVYDASVSITTDQDLPRDAYDSGRDQYRAEAFIDLAADAAPGDRAVGLTTEDLYYRRRNYVFGLAYLDGRSCVVSTNRLGTSSDGGFSQRSPEAVFGDRVRKEVVHEVGHMLGLDHCDNNRCAMSFSPTVQEVDRKEETLCGTCQRELF